MTDDLDPHGTRAILLDEIARLEAELRAARDREAAATSVVHRYRDGWVDTEIVDGEGVWCKGITDEGEWAEEEWMTSDEAVFLAAVSAPPITREDNDA